MPVLRYSSESDRVAREKHSKRGNSNIESKSTKPLDEGADNKNRQVSPAAQASQQKRKFEIINLKLSLNK